VDEQQTTRSILLPHTSERVWRALTNAEQISAWFGARVEIDARPGGRTTFQWPEGGERSAVVEVIEPPRLLVLRWLPFERTSSGKSQPVAPGHVRFILEPMGGGTHLTVRESRPHPSGNEDSPLPLLMTGSM
jgi:uncharacterized protein YndB with AHSA1/START domain